MREAYSEWEAQQEVHGKLSPSNSTSRHDPRSADITAETVLEAVAHAEHPAQEIVPARLERGASSRPALTVTLMTNTLR